MTQNSFILNFKFNVNSICESSYLTYYFSKFDLWIEYLRHRPEWLINTSMPDGSLKQM